MLSKVFVSDILREEHNITVSGIVAIEAYLLSCIDFITIILY